MSIDLPAVGQVHAAADGAPYLAVSLTLEPAVVAALLADLPRGGSDVSATDAWEPGFSVAAMTRSRYSCSSVGEIGFWLMQILSVQSIKCGDV